LVLEITPRYRKRANLVSTLSRNQLLYRVRLEAVVQRRDFSGQTVDEQRGHLRFTPRGVRITDSSKCPPQLVDQAQTMGETLLSWDWATIAATPRKSRTAPRSGAGSPGRFCADRASMSAVAARGPGLFPSRRLDQAANTPAASRAAPRHAGRSDTGTALRRSTDLSTAATARCQSLW
jgi:hypothetical protein